jgi:hypothetical protein
LISKYFILSIFMSMRAASAGPKFCFTVHNLITAAQHCKFNLKSIWITCSSTTIHVQSRLPRNYGMVGHFKKESETLDVRNCCRWIQGLRSVRHWPHRSIVYPPCDRVIVWIYMTQHTSIPVFRSLR